MFRTKNHKSLVDIILHHQSTNAASAVHNNMMMSMAPHVANNSLAPQTDSILEGGNALYRSNIGKLDSSASASTRLLSSNHVNKGVSLNYSLISRELVGTMQRIVAEKTRRTGISSFSSNSIADLVMNESNSGPPNLMKRQLLVEEERLSEAVSSYTANFSNLMRMGRGTSVKSVKRQMLGWYEPLMANINQEIALIKAGEEAVDRRVSKLGF